MVRASVAEECGQGPGGASGCGKEAPSVSHGADDRSRPLWWLEAPPESQVGPGEGSLSLRVGFIQAGYVSVAGPDPRDTPPGPLSHSLTRQKQATAMPGEGPPETDRQLDISPQTGFTQEQQRMAIRDTQSNGATHKSGEQRRDRLL